MVIESMAILRTGRRKVQIPNNEGQYLPMTTQIDTDQIEIGGIVNRYRLQKRDRTLAETETTKEQPITGSK